jgi:hypothetical protein
MSVRPAPAGDISKIRRTTAASASFTLRTTWERPPSGPRTSTFVTPEHPAAGDVPGPSLSDHRVVRPPTCLLALGLVGKGGQRQHDLVGGGVERPLAVLEVKEHAHAAVTSCLT